MTIQRNPATPLAGIDEIADHSSMSQLDHIRSDLFITVADIISNPIQVKCEGLNVAGSIKLKPALINIVVTISPDLGTNYLDTIFNDDWVASRCPGFFDLPRTSGCLEKSSLARVA
jgi:hypothetical protein